MSVEIVCRVFTDKLSLKEKVFFARLEEQGKVEAEYEERDGKDCSFLRKKGEC